MLNDPEEAHKLRETMLKNVEKMNEQSKYDQDWDILCQGNRTELFDTSYQLKDTAPGISMITVPEPVEQFDQYRENVRQSFQNPELTREIINYQMTCAEIGATEVWINREILDNIPGLDREQMEKEAREAAVALEQMKQMAIENRQDISIELSDGTEITAFYQEDSRGIRSAYLQMNGEQMSSEEITDTLKRETGKEYSEELLKSEKSIKQFLEAEKSVNQSRASYKSKNQEVSNNIFGQAAKVFERGAEKVFDNGLDYDNHR